MFKHRLQGLVAGVLIGALLASGFAFAEEISKTVDVVYNNIKIFIDGAEYVAKDANGEVVEPFIYNGTTYLPVRGIANAFGKDVVWDGANQSIYLGKKDQNQPDNYLDRIQYSYYGEHHEEDNFWIINGKVTDFLKNDYNNGILLHRIDTIFSADPIQDDPDGAFILMNYPLNSQYKKLNGKLVLPKSIDIVGLKNDNINGDSPTADVLFYGDGKLLQKFYSVSTTMPFNFDLDIKGVNSLQIKMKGPKGTYLALTGLALYK